MEFPTELGVLTCLALFAATLWLPYVIGIARLPAIAGATDNANRPPDLNQVPAWIHRAHRAHLNLLEQLLPFAILVLLLDRLDGFTALTYWTAITFFWVRIVHAIGMISGWTVVPARSVIFTIGWICVLVMGVAVFAARF